MFEYADPGDIIGLVLMPIAALMLFLKEGRYNYLHKTNKKGERTVATILLLGTIMSAVYSSHSIDKQSIQISKLLKIAHC